MKFSSRAGIKPFDPDDNVTDVTTYLYERLELIREEAATLAATEPRYFALRLEEATVDRLLDQLRAGLVTKDAKEERRMRDLLCEAQNALCTLESLLP